jgi:hypothetical protein
LSFRSLSLSLFNLTGYVPSVSGQAVVGLSLLVLIK